MTWPGEPDGRYSYSQLASRSLDVEELSTRFGRYIFYIQNKYAKKGDCSSSSWVIFSMQSFLRRGSWAMRLHLRHPCQKPPGFILAWPRKICWKTTGGLKQESSDLLSTSCSRETAKGLQWLGSTLQSVWEGITSLTLYPRSQKWLRLHKQPRPARESDSQARNDFSLSLVSLPLTCCCGRFWTVCSLWGNVNSLAISKYLNSFKTTGI